MDLQETLDKAVAGVDLGEAEAQRAMEALLGGEAQAPWIAGWLVALRMKGESSAELAGFARAMREASTRISPSATPLVDTCGTGGDGSGSFNISTTAAFVAAGAGAHVAKHGNRSVSSRCGSADVLEALGARLDLGESAVSRCVDEVGFGFLFAPRHHAAMKHAVAPRKALGLRTVFNILGPLTNPAGARHQLIGVYDGALMPKLARVLARLGGGRSVLVHGDDGLDELTVTGASTMLVVDSEAIEKRIDPVQLGLSIHDAENLRGGDALTNADVTRRVLDGEGGAPRDVVLLNAAAALFACGVADSMEDGVGHAATSIDRGRARTVLAEYVEYTQRYGGEA